MSRPALAWAMVGVASVLGLSAAARADDVTVFTQPPSVEQLREALGAKPDTPAKRMVKTRSIQIDDPDAAAAPVAPPAAYQAPSYQAPSYQAPSPSPQAAAPAYSQPAAPSRPPRANVSEKAVAMQIQFDYNSASIRPESVGFINSVAGLLQSDPASSLVIEGHTDAAGSYAYNLKLSKDRAASVRQMLVERYGIAPSRLISIGRGPSEPLNRADPNAAENRRVQFRLRS